MPGLDPRRLANAAALGCVLLVASCTGKGSATQFAVFLLPLSAQVGPGAPVSEIELPDKRLLSAADMVSYAIRSHEIELKPDSVDRLNDLELTGRTFVVAVGGKPIYRGTFIAPWVSRSDDGVVIVWPPLDGNDSVVRIQLGYPGADFFRGTDPRSDPRILDALARGGPSSD